MQCPKCGNKAQDDAVFCDQCGTRLAAPAATVVEATPAVEIAPVAPVEPVVPEVTQAPAAPEAPAAPAAMMAAVAPQGSICPACKASNTPGEMFCAECGTKLEAPKPEAAAVAQVQTGAAPVTSVAGAPICAACGAVVTASDEFCPACGALLKGQTQGVAPVPAAPAPVAAAPVAAASAAPAAAAPAPTTAAGECPACGAATKAGDTFCEFCGAALVTPDGTAASVAAAATAQQAVIQPAAAPIQTGVGPVLVVVGSGIEIPLPTDRDVIVGREDPYTGVFPDVDLTPHGGVDGGVSRRHLRIVSAGGTYTIEDLNSTNFTLLNRKQVKPGTPVALGNGDEITAGRVKLIFKVR